jgi:hypothetical protein
MSQTRVSTGGNVRTDIAKSTMFDIKQPITGKTLGTVQYQAIGSEVTTRQGTGEALFKVGAKEQIGGITRTFTGNTLAIETELINGKPASSFQFLQPTPEGRSSTFGLIKVEKTLTGQSGFMYQRQAVVTGKELLPSPKITSIGAIRISSYPDTSISFGKAAEPLTGMGKLTVTKESGAAVLYGSVTSKVSIKRSSSGFIGGFPVTVEQEPKVVTVTKDLYKGFEVQEKASALPRSAIAAIFTPPEQKQGSEGIVVPSRYKYTYDINKRSVSLQKVDRKTGDQIFRKTLKVSKTEIDLIKQFQTKTETVRIKPQKGEIYRDIRITGRQVSVQKQRSRSIPKPAATPNIGAGMGGAELEAIGKSISSKPQQSLNLLKPITGTQQQQRVRLKPAQQFGLRSGQGLISKQVLRVEPFQEQLPKQIQPSMQVQEPLLRVDQIVSPKQRIDQVYDFPVPNLPSEAGWGFAELPSAVPAGFKLPFGFWFDGGGRQRGGNVKFRKKYFASVEATAFGIKGKRSRIAEITGLGTRPILRR